MNDNHFGEFTALEALEYLIHADISELADITPHKGERGFEFAVMAQCFVTLMPWRAESWISLPLRLTRIVRRHFAQHATLFQISRVATDCINPILSTLDPDKLDKKLLSIITIQIASALLSLMKHHSDLEFTLYTIDSLAEIWGDDISLALSRYVIINSHAAHPKSNDIQIDNHVKGDVSPCGAMPECADGPSGHTLLPPQRGTPRCAQIPDSDALIIDSFLKHHKITGDPGSCLKILFSAIQRRYAGDGQWFIPILRNKFTDFPHLWPCSDDHLWPDFNEFALFWIAQAYRESGAPAYALDILEQAFASSTAFSPILWLLLADILIDDGQFGRAVHAIECAKQDCPRISARPLTASMIADIHAHPNPVFYAKDFGISSPYITADADNNAPYLCEMNISCWNNAIIRVQNHMGYKAFHKALHSPDIDVSLLEISLDCGDDDIKCEAALCVFDGHIEDIREKVWDVLSAHPNVREKFILSLAKRHDLSRLDDLYDAYNQISLRIAGDIHSNADICFLEALSKYDAPYAAVDPLMKSIHGLNRQKEIFWIAVDCWIELNALQNDFDAAISGIAFALGDDSPYALRSLLNLMSYVPREIFGTMQAILCENIGPQQTQDVFKRLKALHNPYQSLNAQIAEMERSRHAETPPMDAEQASVWMMPLSWQLAYLQSKHRQAKPMDDKAMHRQQILMSRGVLPQKNEAPPEPAQWVHTSQKRASDAFDQ